MFKLLITVIISIIAIISGVVLALDGLSKASEMQEGKHIADFSFQAQLLIESYEIAMIENYDLPASLKQNSYDYPKALSAGNYVGEIPEYNGFMWHSDNINGVDFFKVEIKTDKNCILIEQERDVRVTSIPSKPIKNKDFNLYGCWEEYDKIEEDNKYYGYYVIKREDVKQQIEKLEKEIEADKPNKLDSTVAGLKASNKIK
jgi:hypothetical protein